jgi:23S rRNA (uridine2552-2'-O)-methyltransferase
LPNRWLRERRRDPYYRRAKEEGYRSRAAFKLLQVNKKYNFVKKGNVVVDLGAAPGGWTQVASHIVGDKGFVLGVDHRKMQILNLKNVKTIVADIKDPKCSEIIMENLSRNPDVILSDASPNISGVWDVDHARQIELAETTIDIAKRILWRNGYFFCKVFHGYLLKDFLDKIKKQCGFVKIVKPSASRKKSSEIYILVRKIMKGNN